MFQKYKSVQSWKKLDILGFADYKLYKIKSNLLTTVFILMHNMPKYKNLHEHKLEKFKASEKHIKI